MVFSVKLRQAVLCTACFVFMTLGTVPFASGQSMSAQSMSAQSMSASDKLIAAAGKGDVAAVQAALREGAPADARDRSGRTALLIATHANSVRWRGC